jgi:hypothetical protein
VYLAESAAPGVNAPGRVRALELDVLGQSVVLVKELGVTGVGLPRPTALALERGGARLLVITDAATADGVRELRGVDLGGPELGEVFEVAADLADDATGLATGPDGLRVLASPAAGDLAVGGGVEQKRTLAGYDPSTQTALVTTPFLPLPRGGQRWRWSKQTDLPFATGPSGAQGMLLWDTREVLGGGAPILRLTPYDQDRGSSSSTIGVKSVRAPEVGDWFQLAGITRPEDVACADLNGDGLLDLVTANSVSGDVALFFQTAPGRFPAVPDLTRPAGGPTDVELADLNGDGLLDLVSASPDQGLLFVYFQTGAGQLPAVPDLLLGSGATTSGVEAVAAADLDDDGRLDLVCANRDSARLAVFFQSAPGQFPTVPDLSLGGAQSATTKRFVRVADVDGDGRLDLVTSNRDGRTLKVFFQESTGQFSAVTVGGVVPDPGIWTAAVADLNGDGLQDLVSGNHKQLFQNPDGDNLTVFFQTAPRQFPAAPDLTLGSTLTNRHPADVEVADLNGDGLLDLIAANELTVDVAVFLQVGPGQFPTSPNLLVDTPGSNLSAVAVADLNGDGRLDFTVASRGTDDLAVQLQFLPGQLPEAPDVTLGGLNPRGIVTGDLNADGLPDLATAAGDLLFVYFQKTPALYPPSPDLQLGGTTLTQFDELVIADLNGDGLSDLASANRLSKNLTVFFQSSPGQFSIQPDLVLGGPTITLNPTFVAAADLNDDDRVDLVCANTGPPSGGTNLDNNLMVFFQTSPGRFGVPGSSPVQPNLTLGDATTTPLPEAVAAADLNGDELIDLVCANKGGNSLTVFFQTGSGQFPLAPDLTLGNQATTFWPTFVLAADMNADGRSDLVSVNNFAHTLSVFFQTGPGQFPLTPDVTLGSFATTPFPQSVVAVDLDGEGLVDLVVTPNEQPSTVEKGLKVFLQTSPGRFPSTPSFVIPSPSGSTGRAHSADLNSDGQADLVEMGSGVRMFFAK